MATKPTAMQIIGRLLRTMIYSLIAMLCGFLVWRIYISTIPPQEIKRLSVNDTLASAYDEYGDDLQLFNQNQSSITRTEETYAFFTIVDYVIIPEAGQVQVLLRYNKSIAGHLYEDFSLDEIPDRESELFDLSLVKTVDLTPLDTEDNGDSDYLEEVRYAPSEIIKDSTILYIYRRIVFDNVDIGDAVGLFFDVYYIENTDYDFPPYGALCLYDSTYQNNPVKLSSADKKALREAVK